MSGAKADLWALDFDGVICDSCGESSISAWKAASKLWPELFNAQCALDKKDAVLEDMRAVRPVVETGYENIVQVRCLLEGVKVDDVLENWSELLPQYMAKWELARDKLVELFGSTRDEWMAEDLQGWLAPNRMYDGLPEALKAAVEHKEVYIVTTKQARFTATLLQEMAGFEFPLEKIFSTTVSGQPKTEVLENLEGAHPGMNYMFIEDKLATLQKVCADSKLNRWQLLFADWGYNTLPQRNIASADSRMRLVSLQEFASMLAE
eukprot:evm.model.scf_313EXC.3 EVM.evm.TU.scf_313EXC.3   scf_313EXC:25657-29939(-)